MPKKWKQLLKFRCTACGKCCQEPMVIVTVADVLRIQKHTQQKTEDIVCFQDPNDIEWDTDNPEWIKCHEGLRLLSLRQTPSGCQYLNEQLQCSIYTHRPITCRRYPFNVEINHKNRIIDLSISDAVECPYELNGTNQEEEIKSLVEWETQEEEPYFEKIRQWNTEFSHKSITEFLSFIGL